MFVVIDDIGAWEREMFEALVEKYNYKEPANETFHYKGRLPETTGRRRAQKRRRY
jgi:hypothetical protein